MRKRKIIIFSLIFVLLAFGSYGCSKKPGDLSGKSDLEKKIDRKILQSISSDLDSRGYNVTWGGNLYYIVEKSKPYWTGRNIHSRAGFLPIKAEKNKEPQDLEVAFVAAYGEEDGNLIPGSGECKIWRILNKKDSGYKKDRNYFVSDIKKSISS